MKESKIKKAVFNIIGLPLAITGFVSGLCEPIWFNINKLYYRAFGYEEDFNRAMDFNKEVQEDMFEKLKFKDLES